MGAVHSCRCLRHAATFDIKLTSSLPLSRFMRWAKIAFEAQRTEVKDTAALPALLYSCLHSSCCPQCVRRASSMAALLFGSSTLLARRSSVAAAVACPAPHRGDCTATVPLKPLPQCQSNPAEASGSRGSCSGTPRYPSHPAAERSHRDPAYQRSSLVSPAPGGAQRNSSGTNVGAHLSHVRPARRGELHRLAQLVSVAGQTIHASCMAVRSAFDARRQCTSYITRHSNCAARTVSVQPHIHPAVAAEKQTPSCCHSPAQRRQPSARLLREAGHASPALTK